MKTYKRIEAVRKTGEILKFLANQKEPISGADIAKSINLAAGTCMCHLATLEDLGFTVSIGDRWKLGLGLALIYARVKSNLEADRTHIEHTINKLETGEE